MKTISLEQLAEKLNGKLWVKGDLKRIYLDRGYNTKKMSTKTYVEEVDGEFVVKCFVDCPSQPYQWIKSQQEEVIENVEKDIENIIKISTLELVDYRILEEKAECMVYVKRNADTEASWFTEEIFYDEFGSYPAEVFGGKVEADLEVIYEKRREERRIQKEQEATEKKEAIADEAKKLQESGAIPSDAERVKHERFGLGTVITSTSEKIEILFDDSSIGKKSFVTKFVKLEFINE